jgi:organic hydroperoxide reductase OsmC/OhrA
MQLRPLHYLCVGIAVWRIGTRLAFDDRGEYGLGMRRRPFTEPGDSMSESREHHVTLRFLRGYEFDADFEDAEGLPHLQFDEPPPLGHGLAPNAAAVLGAAVGNCLSASLVFCLRKVRLEPLDLTTRVVTHVTRNENGRFRITGIDVEIQPQLSEPDEERFERCERLFEDFCVVTESVRQGIPVKVTVADPARLEETR